MNPLLLDKISIIPGIVCYETEPREKGLDFTIDILKDHPIRFMGSDCYITQTMLTTWFFMLVLVIFALICRSQLKKYTDKPTGGQNVIEMIVEAMDSFTRNNMGDRFAYFGKWFFGIFTFILLSNLSGLLGFRPPTADLATTVAMTLCTFFLIHFMGITKGKAGYFKSYLEPIPILLPINIIGELATPISLSFRLFGNILGGMIIMSMVYSLPIWLNFGIPAVLHAYFDVFAGVLQTFIFCMLSQLFIRDKIPD